MNVNDLLDAILLEVAALNLTLDGAAVPAVKRKRPAKTTYDPEVQLNVCPSEGTGDSRVWAFRKAIFTHRADLVLIVPNQNDLKTNVDEYGGIVDGLAAHFSKPLSWALTGTRNVRSKPKVFLAPKWLGKGYDYLAIEVSVEEVKTVIA